MRSCYGTFLSQSKSVRSPQHRPDKEPQVEGSTAPPRHDRTAPHVGELQERNAGAGFREHGESRARARPCRVIPLAGLAGVYARA